MTATYIRFGTRRLRMPGNRIARTALGIALILGGCVGFLPILGFWMVPLGLIILSIDMPSVRRWRRKSEVAVLRRHRAGWWKKKG